MNKATLVIFTILCLLFIANGLYRGIAHDQWTSMMIAIVVIVFGGYRLVKKQKKG
ncbi:hypothetical protein H0266_09220 [Halobacillus locisalis]|uniref:Uncharacterized protein n=1 Tax=Halobacillus locisalis TaxID=220753 RepID=A0A838CSZ8_9BACI|nr:hypothetical protein [Halobacillus locisalis]MBA2175071.1 hypothetical protein [Halobacillus locisalis]